MAYHVLIHSSMLYTIWRLPMSCDSLCLSHYDMVRATELHYTVLRPTKLVYVVLRSQSYLRCTRLALFGF